MEQQGDYVTEQEVEDAMDMLGKGFEAAYEIHKGETVIRESEGGQQEYDTGAWVKIAAPFRNKHLKILKGSRLGVWLCIVLHINEKNNSHPSIETICKETGYSNREVIDCIRELEERGYLTVIRGEQRYNIYHVNFGAAYGVGNTPTCELSSPVKFDAGNGELSSKNLLKTSLKEEPIKKNQTKKKGDLVDGILAYLNPQEQKALTDFEAALGFGTLPWYSSSAWEKFRKFVIRVSTGDPDIWKDYAAWREDGGKYKAFSNRKIRENPAAFMDTGYPEYEASKMYRQPAPKNTANQSWRQEVNL